MRTEGSCGTGVFTSSRLRHQDRRSGGRAAFEVTVCLRRVAKRIFLIHRDLDRSLADDVEQVIGDRNQILALGRISIERRARRIKRSLGLQNIDVESIDLPGGAAEAHEETKR